MLAEFVVGDGPGRGLGSVRESGRLKALLQGLDAPSEEIQPAVEVHDLSAGLFGGSIGVGQGFFEAGEPRRIGVLGVLGHVGLR